jgi:hypothetical protein
MKLGENFAHTVVVSRGEVARVKFKLNACILINKNSHDETPVI